MDALMLCLIASAVAAFGGRWWLLGSAIAARKGVPVALPGIAVSAIVAAGLSAVAGGLIADGVRGPGMLLFLALSLLFGGASALWPVKPIADRVTDSARGPVTATILLLATQLSDSAPFIILAAAAWSQTGGFAAFGGAIGLLAAAGAGLAIGPDQRTMVRVGQIRIAVGIVLLLLGAWVAVSALGLV